MKKLASFIIAIIVIASMSTVAMAADSETIYPNGGKDSTFAGETVNKDVNVGLAYDNEGTLVEIDNWDIQDGYAVDITWSNLSFLYVIEGADSTVTTQYVSKWDPDQLKWIIWDTDKDEEVIAGLDGKYDTDALSDFADVDSLTVTSINDDIIDKDLGVNGFAVTNRSSQDISVAYSYNQSTPLYDVPGDALGAKNANIPAVNGQVGGDGCEARLYTSYNFLNAPENPPAAPGVCGTVTITIG